jgi:predicted nuclease with RNAse H fold
MSQPVQTLVGIDVGGEEKGFHAVALRGRMFVDKTTAADPAVIVAWCQDRGATVVAVDAPCQWSQTGSSRLAERELKLFGEKIFCFATPTRERAENHDKGFYDWVFNGEELYRLLVNDYPLFNGVLRQGKACIETFPHAVVCVMAGKVLKAANKKIERPNELKKRGYDISRLSDRKTKGPNIDYVDAALCAVTADEFGNGKYQCFGNPEEGFIVVPACCAK